MNRRVLGVPSATGQLRGTNDFDNVALVGDDEELVSGEVVLVGGDVALMGGDVALVGDGVSWWVCDVAMEAKRLHPCETWGGCWTEIVFLAGAGNGSALLAEM